MITWYGIHKHFHIGIFRCTNEKAISYGMHTYYIAHKGRLVYVAQTYWHNQGETIETARLMTDQYWEPRLAKLQ